MTPVPISPGRGIKLLSTGIPGFDTISSGGLPLERLTLVSGTAGAAKTVFAAQFLVEGIRQAGEACVFVSLEESPADIRASMLSLGSDIADFEAQAKWALIGRAAQAGDEETLVGDYDELRRRTLVIMKVRGLPHRCGEFPFVMLLVAAWKWYRCQRSHCNTCQRWSARRMATQNST